MLFCIEVDRSGVGEESIVLHHRFEKEPTRKDVLKLIEEEDCGYDDIYCRFNYYIVSEWKNY